MFKPKFQSRFAGGYFDAMKRLQNENRSASEVKREVQKSSSENVESSLRPKDEYWVRFDKLYEHMLEPLGSVYAGGSLADLKKYSALSPSVYGNLANLGKPSSMEEWIHREEKLGGFQLEIIRHLNSFRQDHEMYSDDYIGFQKAKELIVNPTDGDLREMLEVGYQIFIDDFIKSSVD